MNESESSPRASRWPLIVSLVLLAGLIAAYWWIPGFRSFTQEAWKALTADNQDATEEWVRQFGWWGPLLIVVAMTLQMFLIVVPTWALMSVTVLAYGAAGGVVLIIVSVLIAASVGYWIGRSLSDVTLGRLIGPANLQKIQHAVERHGFTTVVLIRLAPFLSNDAISFVAGMVGMSYWRFIAATLAGITPLALLIAWVGRDWESLKQGLIWGSAVCLVAYALYLAWDHGWLGKHSSEPPQ